MAEEQQQDTADILKYFIGVMGLLTLLVCLFSILYYVQTLSAEQSYTQERNELSQMKTLAANPDFRDKIKLDVESQGTMDQGESLSDFLIREADKTYGVKDYIRERKPSVQKGAGFEASRVTLFMDRKERRIPLKKLTRFLYNVQAQAPSIKVERLLLSDLENGAWRATVTFVKYRPLENPTP